MNELLSQILAAQQKQEISAIIAYNEKTRKYGLSLIQEDVKSLVISKWDNLQETQRIEFGESILPHIIDAFYDSPYISQENYAQTLAELQEIFYLFKNESLDELPDAELLDFMEKQFNDTCFGDLDYLKGTCLERFAKAIRSGYMSKTRQRLHDEYSLKEVDNPYRELDEETRWEYDLYRTKLENLGL